MRKHLPLVGSSAELAALAVFTLACALVYTPVIAKLAGDWWADPDYSHGMLCAPLAIGIVIARRRRLAAIPRQPRTAGLAGAAAAMGLLLIGRLGAELFLTRASLLLFAASAVVFLFGWRHLRAVAFPLVLLLLAVPIPAILVTRITLPLQFVASSTTEAALGVMNVPVLREGNVLVLPNATLQVAEACSGIRSLVSLVVFALIVARYGEHRPASRALVVASAVPAAILMNTLRVTVTAVATFWYGPAAAEGVLHETVGVVMFAVATGLVLLFARGLARLRGRYASGVAA